MVPSERGEIELERVLTRTYEKIKLRLGMVTLKQSLKSQDIMSFGLMIEYVGVNRRKAFGFHYMQHFNCF